MKHSSKKKIKKRWVKEYNIFKKYITLKNFNK